MTEDTVYAAETFDEAGNLEEYSKVLHIADEQPVSGLVLFGDNDLSIYMPSDIYLDFDSSATITITVVKGDTLNEEEKHESDK